MQLYGLCHLVLKKMTTIADILKDIPELKSKINQAYKYGDAGTIQLLLGVVDSLERALNDFIAGQVDKVWENCNDPLFQALAHCYKLVKNLSEDIVALHLDNSEIVEKISQCEEKWDEMRLTMMVGQVAMDIDDIATSIVLKDLVDKSKARVRTINQMEKALRGEIDGVFTKGKDEREKAKKRWDDLQLKIRWTPNHKRFINDLKDGPRLGFAHPKVYLPELKKAHEKGRLPGVDNDRLFSECLNMLHILQDTLAKS